MLSHSDEYSWQATPPSPVYPTRILFLAGQLLGIHGYPVVLPGDGHAPGDLYSNSNDYDSNNHNNNNNSSRKDDDASFGPIMPFPDELRTSSSGLALTTIATNAAIIPAAAKQDGDGHIAFEGTEVCYGDVAAKAGGITATL